MAADSLLVLQASTTKATTFNGTGIKISSGTPRRGLWARIIVNDGHSTTTNTALFSIDVSADDSTYYVKVQDNEHQLALTTTVQSAEYYLPVHLDGTGDLYVRLTVTIAGAGTASVKYESELILGQPG